jgi:hypothetical protein
VDWLASWGALVEADASWERFRLTSSRLDPICVYRGLRSSVGHGVADGFADTWTQLVRQPTAARIKGLWGATLLRLTRGKRRFTSGRGLTR